MACGGAVGTQKIGFGAGIDLRELGGVACVFGVDERRRAKEVEGRLVCRAEAVLAAMVVGEVKW